MPIGVDPLHGEIKPVIPGWQPECGRRGRTAGWQVEEIRFPTLVDGRPDEVMARRDH